MKRKRLIFGSGLSSAKDLSGLTEVCDAAIECGITSFDTAPSYRTEEILSNAIRVVMDRRGVSREQLWIQTKIDPIQMYEGHVLEYFERKLGTMRLEYVDALLIHWPVYKYFRGSWNSLQLIRKRGLARHIGICNLRIEHLNELKGIGIVPEILQIERHPLNTFMDEAKFCSDNNIILQDYSPLCKMHPLLNQSALLESLSQKYCRSIGQIILRWHFQTGAIPVFTSKRPSRIREYAQVHGFELLPEDIDKISSLNCNHKLYLESLVCPGF